MSESGAERRGKPAATTTAAPAGDTGGSPRVREGEGPVAGTALASRRAVAGRAADDANATGAETSPWPRLAEVRRLPALGPIAAVALDVDGTILQSDLRVARRTRRAIRALRARGVHVIIATGRRIGTAARYARAAGAGPSCDIVALDGALVTDQGGRRALRVVPIDADAAATLLRWAEELDLAFVANTRSRLFGTVTQAPVRVLREHRRRGVLRTVSGVVHTLWEIPPVRPARTWDPHQEPMLKFSPLGPREASAALRERIERAGLPVHLTTPGGAYFEVVARGISKGEGLAWLLARRGLDPRRTLAIGDGWNDVQMFLRVGHAVAMGNAHSGVKAYARWVTAGVDEGGVAEVLERVLAGAWPPSEEGEAGVREASAAHDPAGAPARSPGTAQGSSESTRTVRSHGGDEGSP